MTNEGRVYFSLFGEDFDPDEVTRRIGIEPTYVRRKGNPTPRCSSWEVSTNHIGNDLIDIYEMSSALVTRLGPYAKKIAEVRQQLELRAVLEVVLRITTDETKSTPAIGFDSEVISFLNTVGASVDIDTHLNYG